MAKNIVPFGLRLQPELKARVAASAKANGRSINAEIAYQLSQAYSAETLLAIRDDYTAYKKAVLGLGGRLSAARAEIEFAREEHARMDSMAGNS